MLRINYNLKNILVFFYLLFFSLVLLQSIEYEVHTVRKGDTLYGLSKRYGVSVVEIKRLNGLTSDALSIKQKLKIKPKSTSTTVQQNTTTKLKKKERISTQETPPSITPTTPSGRQTTPSTASAPPVLPPEYYHEVKPKETLFRIAQSYGITLQQLLDYNGFPDEHVLVKVGHKIIIKDPASFVRNPSETPSVAPTTAVESAPTTNTETDSVLIEKVYIVQSKDTLFRIAKKFNMTVDQLRKLNNLTDNNLKAGQKLYIIAPKAKDLPEQTQPEIITEEELKTKEKIRNDLIMPVDGKVISEYGIRNGRPHKGIDIGAPNGTPIFSVLDGTVVYVGYQGNYGNVIVVEHPDFIMTVYGHNEKNLVAVGDQVKQGQIIATVGTTGNATAPHVHFEYRIKGKAINPRKVLPLSP